MILKYKKHWWQNSSDESVELPDDTVFICKNGDVGPCLYDGFNHYLAATRSKEKIKGNSPLYHVYNRFPGITFILFNNIIIESNVSIITGEEFYKKFELGTYYIFNYIMSFDENKTINTPVLMSVNKILSIDGPYCASTITAGSILNTLLSINIEKCINFVNLIDGYSDYTEVKRNCEEEFVNYINKSLNSINYKVVYDQPVHLNKTIVDYSVPFTTSRKRVDKGMSGNYVQESELETTSSSFLNFDNMKIDWNEYNCFLVECYEAEDEFWKNVYEDIEADRIISEEK